jgi:tRNA-uridine 2-sulfurtransferase
MSDKINKTVLVGLSGGVDSSLALILLQEAGYHVIGVSMSIYNQDIPNLLPAGNACYGAEEKTELKEVADFCRQRAIEYHIFDCSEEYKKIVLSYFREEYLSGRTPNPCVRCNASMKFGLLPQAAQKQGIPYDFFATGHYARVEKDEKSGRFLLKKGLDGKKDQSYFLYRLTQEQLQKTLFPLGNMTKEQTRKMAAERKIPASDKEDSQDFYAGHYTDLLQAEPKKGLIRHINGQILGTHNGFWNFTIGQRKGLGVSYKEPLFVVDLDAEHNIVVVGAAGDLSKKEAIVTNACWIAFDKMPKEPFEAVAKHRSTQAGQKVLVLPLPEEKNGFKVIFEEPQKSLTPGQSLVLYQEDIVLGGGILSA